MTASGNIRRRLFGIPSPRKVFSRPGFAPEAWQRFAPVAESLALGYNASLEDSSLPTLTARLDTVDPALRGFAYEGAGMGLTALDVMAPWRKRLATFVAGPGGPHIYPVYVGVGLALARLHRHPERHLDRLDPLLGWAIVDGYGFHGGFFARRRFIVKGTRPAHLSDHGQRMFDQGLGRAIWFSSGAVLWRVTKTIAGFQPDRQASLWNGAAMACSFGGGADRGSLDELCEVAGDHRPELSWAAATAAWTREMAGNHAPHTELACEVLCGTSSADAARVLEESRRELDGTSLPAPFETWRGNSMALLGANEGSR